MLIPDPLRPYAELIRIGLWACVAVGLLLMGARLGSDYRERKDQVLIEKAEKQRDRAQADADENLRDANACGQLLSDVNDETLRQVEEAKRAKAAAEQAASRAQAAAAAGQRRALAAEKALQDAKSTPACRSQLEMPLCDAIPLL